MGYYLDDQQRPVIACDNVKTPRAYGEPLGDVETRGYHYTGDQLELAVLRHCRKEWIYPEGILI